MAGEVFVGAIGAVDFLRLGPLGDMLGGRILVMSCLFPFLVIIFARSSV